MAQIDINGLKFKQTRKKKYDVYLCMPARGTQVTNRLEGAQYVTDDNKPFVLSGTVGEQWVIDPAKLTKTYLFADGREITPDALKSRMQGGMIDWVRLTTRQVGFDVNFAAHLPLSVKNFPVQTSWGDILYANRDGVGHGKGDFLVCTSINGQPNLNDMWVVNGEVFPTTYDMRAFPGLGTATTGDIPVPKSLAKTDGKFSTAKLGEWLANKLTGSGVEVEYSPEESEDWQLRLNGTPYGVQVNLGSNKYDAYVIAPDEEGECIEIGHRSVRDARELPKAILSIVNNHARSRNYIAKTIMNGLRQRGDRVGKLQDGGQENCSFSVNNGKYGVILYINAGNPEEGSNSISVMYHNNGTWDEAATWFIDDYGMNESINKLHALVNGASNLDGMISKVSQHMPGAIHDEYAFESYRMGNNDMETMEKPTYFKQLLKTYNYVKDKLQLIEPLNGMITQTNEEPVHWRIDFGTRLCEQAMPFIDIYPDHLTVCIQTQDGGHWEQDFPVGADGCKRGFQYIANIVKVIKSGNY